MFKASTESASATYPSLLKQRYYFLSKGYSKLCSIMLTTTATAAVLFWWKWRCSYDACEEQNRAAELEILTLGAEISLPVTVKFKKKRDGFGQLRAGLRSYLTAEDIP